MKYSKGQDNWKHWKNTVANIKYSA
jgi:hypothetical protein